MAKTGTVWSENKPFAETDFSMEKKKINRGLHTSFKM